MADKFVDGLKHDGGKPRLSLVPPILIKAVGTVMTHGAEKYGEASLEMLSPTDTVMHLQGTIAHIWKTHTAKTKTADFRICGT
jgi:hypothetical protein